MVRSQRRGLLGGAGSDENVGTTTGPAAVARGNGNSLVDHLGHEVVALGDEHAIVVRDRTGQDLVGCCLGGGRLLVLERDASVGERRLVLRDLALGAGIVRDDGDADLLDGDGCADIGLQRREDVAGDLVELILRDGRGGAGGTGCTGLTRQAGQRVIAGERRIQLDGQVVVNQVRADVGEILVVLVQLVGSGRVDLPLHRILHTGRALVGQAHGGAGTGTQSLVVLLCPVEGGDLREGADEVESVGQLAIGVTERRDDADLLGGDLVRGRDHGHHTDEDEREDRDDAGTVAEHLGVRVRAAASENTDDNSNDGDHQEDDREDHGSGHIKPFSLP